MAEKTGLSIENRSMKFDIVIIGSGPAGQKAAIAASKLGKRVAIIERNFRGMGGVCLHKGTIPSKTMREAILYLTGYRHRDVYSKWYRRKRRVTMQDLRLKLADVAEHELEIIHDQLERNGVDIFIGEAQFVSPHEVAVDCETGRKILHGDYILVATGTKPSRPPHIPFDGETIFDSDEIIDLKQIPRSMIVVGGGVIGIEYAIMFATLGVEVTVLDGREHLLEFCDREIIDALIHHARSLGMVFRMGEEVVGIERFSDSMAAVQTESGKRLVADSVLYTVGRVGDADELNFQAAGLEPDERGRLWCNEDHQTWVPHIYGAGDIVGFPALASVSMEQGRRVICNAFNEPFEAFDLMPYGLFTIPEISMVGKTEQQLTEAHIPYEVGAARYREIARGQISGDRDGMLKILFHRETLKILGIHAIGEAATEIVHIGQTVMSFGGTIEYFRNAVFNYPTMAECYKVAAFDALEKMSLDRLFEASKTSKAAAPLNKELQETQDEASSVEVLTQTK